MLSYTEENYLKAIYKVYEKTKDIVSTNAIAEEINTTAASVTDMIKKLAAKELIIYEKYKGSKLTNSGAKIATNLIRKHRLWETFLVETLAFSWDEVHQIAEDLEHINSVQLIDRLDEFLNFPKYDPHGDPIPNAEGKFTLREQINLQKLVKGDKGHLIGVNNHDDSFLSYLNELGIGLGSFFEVIERFSYDKSLKVSIDQKEPILLTDKVAKNLFLKKEN
jgi:DtxR family transcriptional regulator, Mn-dependent transcriptional regulator